MQIIDSQDFGVIFVMVLSDEKTEANELAFVQDNNLDFTAEEQGFLLWDDFDTVSGEADTVVLFKPD
ncbi:MAG: hypothetical protein CL489_16640, partial [Acidobacteria bacterium]|nr:hypothetical protein [Acidobacteriota bacterium]